MKSTRRKFSPKLKQEVVAIYGLESSPGYNDVAVSPLSGALSELAALGARITTKSVVAGLHWPRSRLKTLGDRLIPTRIRTLYFQ